MLPLVLLLLWFGCLISVLGATTSSSCMATFLRINCGTIAEYSTCCSIIATASTIGQQCICNTFNSDTSFLAQSMTYCTTYVNTVIDICQGSSTTTPTSDIYSPPASSSASSDGVTSGGNSSTIVIAIVVPIVIIVVVIVVIIIICTCRKQPKLRPNDPSYLLYPQNAYVDVRTDQVSPAQTIPIDVPPLASTTQMSNVSGPTKKDDFKTDKSLHFELATIQIATNHFSNDNKIGRGGFGIVYKGTLSNGQEIAVKRLSNGSGQGDKEFKAEIELLAKLQHRNVVHLLGFCLEGDEALLVYELVPNKSLDHFLFDVTKREQLGWPTRFAIIKGIARGMLYLHEDSPLRTVHRDLKAANVLLDAKMNPKIADFGLARICALEQTHIDATRVLGTRGYMSPEYLHHGQFSVKSDVYAFGVIVLEIIGGRRVGSGSNNQSGEPNENLVSYAWRCWGDEKPLTLMDPLLKDSFSSDEVIKCIHIGLLCVQNDMSKRPDMSTVVHKLNSNPNIASLDMPQFPGFLYNSSSDQTTTSMTTQSATGSSVAWSGR